ncbi:hypothetical protein ACH5RR_021576, partial [Cinchona calisaya]
MPPSLTTLSSKDHTLIQALLSRGPLKESEFRSIFNQVTGKSPGWPSGISLGLLVTLGNVSEYRFYW